MKKIKKYITLSIMMVFLALMANVTFSQNLVINPSFEIYTSCPTNINSGTPDQVIKATGWYTALGTPDYFNVCAPLASQVGVPNNELGYQYPATGDAYCGFVTWGGGNNYREIINSQLLLPLSIGQKYFISFKVSFGGAPIVYGVASDKMGVKFSTVQYTTSSPPPINNFAHVYSSSIITDTLHWVKVKGSFISDSSYQFINIGNFFDDAHTDTLQLSNNGNNYYYVEDICVNTDSNSCYSSESIQEISFQELLVYPNPADEKIVIEHIEQTLDEGKIYDVMWQTIAQFPINRSDKIIIDCSKWNDGFYFIKTKKQFQKIIINHKH